MDTREIMTRDVVTASPTDTVRSALLLLEDQDIRHLPVVDDGGHLAGIISIGDVVKARVGQLEHENNQLHDYIQAR